MEGRKNAFSRDGLPQPHAAVFRPDWDGPIQKDDGYDPDAPGDEPVTPLPSGSGGFAEKPVVDADRCQVAVWGKTVSVYDSSGKLLRQENSVDYTKRNILGEYASLDNFIRQWSAEEKKEAIRALFRERGIDLDAMKTEQNRTGVDDFDFICHVAFDRKPFHWKRSTISRTRSERIRATC